MLLAFFEILNFGERENARKSSSIAQWLVKLLTWEMECKSE